MLNRHFMSGIIFCMMLGACTEKKKREIAAVVVKGPDILKIDTMETDTFPRKSITFILGKDENSRNPYYSLADQYYRLSDSEKTEIVIDTIFSLLEVRNYLEVHRPENGRAWGLINLVSHGNEFVDLSVLVSKTGSRTSEESLLKAIADSVFRPLDSLTADKKTLIHLHGCAVGNNTDLLKAIGKAFGGIKSVNVKASKMFEYYAYLSTNKDPQSIRHYYAKVWYAYYKSDSLPSNEVLAEQLRERYPNDSIDWEEAIQKQFPSNPSEAYHLNLKIPVVWEDFYESKAQLPDLRTKIKQKKWFENKAEMQAMILKTKIPKEYFDPKFYMLIYDGENGTVYSNKVKAKAGVICIIKPVVGAAFTAAPFTAALHGCPSRP